jgi:very-short-patch-repair endonuclease
VLDARLGQELCESAAEHRLRRLLVGAGLPAPVAQYRIRIGTRTVRVDFAYPEHGVVIEYDGWEFHRPRSVFDTDRARGNDLELLDYRVLRFTSASTPDSIVSTVRAALRRRSAS